MRKFVRPKRGRKSSRTSGEGPGGLLSAKSLFSVLSFWSVGSILSVGSVLSIGSAGSILSIGGAGSSSRSDSGEPRQEEER